MPAPTSGAPVRSAEVNMPGEPGSVGEGGRIEAEMDGAGVTPEVRAGSVAGAASAVAADGDMRARLTWARLLACSIVVVAGAPTRVIRTTKLDCRNVTV